MIFLCFLCPNADCARVLDNATLDMLRHSKTKGDHKFSFIKFYCNNRIKKEEERKILVNNTFPSFSIVVFVVFLFGVLCGLCG